MGVFKHDMVLLRGGDVRIYRRDDHEDPKWQVQFRVDGEERTVRRTTGLYDLDEAKRRALDIYDEFKFRKKYDIPVFEKSVAGVAKEFLKEQKKLVKIGQLTNSMYRIYKKSLRYWSEMIPSQNINKLQEADLTQYLEWRVNYYVTGPGKDLKGNRAGVKGKPADGTLQHEFMSINKMIEWAVRKGYLQQKNAVPYKFKIKNPANVRPAFTLDQYVDLGTFMGSWVADYNNSFTIRRRKLLKRLVQFMFNTGVRPPEARNLKWMDVEFFVDDAGEDSVRITVRGKDKRRTFIPFYAAVNVLNFHKKETAYTKNEDYVFCNDKGERMDNPTQQFANLLERAGLTHDSEGKKFTLYSLRHTHITFRIKYQKMDSLLIAKNAGTSVDKIEKHYGHVVPAEFAVELASAEAMNAQMLRTIFKVGR